MKPATRPKLTRDELLDWLEQEKVDGYSVILVGKRGYYLAMGKPGKNDRGIYDDAIFLLSPTAFARFNANTDPSIFRPRVATLQPGQWIYKIGVHGLSKPKNRRYKALVQAAPVTVGRDGAGTDTGWFGINIHRGSKNSTSSLGCQTIPPDQWPEFIGLVEAEMKRHGQKTIPYVLLP
jgi:lysozyme